jgi:hypothetical protein
LSAQNDEKRPSRARPAPGGLSEPIYVFDSDDDGDDDRLGVFLAADNAVDHKHSEREVSSPEPEFEVKEQVQDPSSEDDSDSDSDDFKLPVDWSTSLHRVNPPVYAAQSGVSPVCCFL